MSLNDLTSYEVLAEHIRQLMANRKTARGDGDSEPSETESVLNIIRELSPAPVRPQTSGSAHAGETDAPSMAERGLFSSNLNGLIGLAGNRRNSNPLEYLSPVIGAIASLFSPKQEPEPEPVYLKYYPLTRTAREQRGIAAGPYGEAVAVDYSEQGLPRPIASPAQPSITVNVQAIDSRSFLDYSSEIAAAMRRALYESGGIQGGDAEV